ncbi:hypothetical protein J1N35_022918, partial [Gossypium stocksii]
IKISSKIGNGPIILNVDCDMYSNNSKSIKYSLCIFMDEEKGDEFGYVQFPQSFDNLTKNDIYGCSFRVIQKLEVQGLDVNGGPCFIGTGCFHMREALYGKKYEKNFRFDLKKLNNTKVNERASLIEKTCKVLASYTFEHKTTWGKRYILLILTCLIYSFPMKDIVTGLSVQCRGWKSMFLDPKRDGFLGVAPITLLQLLVQCKRWTEGHLQVFLSKYCPLLYGYKKIPLKLRLAYCAYNLWAANWLATLYYVVVPYLCLLKGIMLFPKISSPWVLPFAYVAFSRHAYSLGEFLWCEGYSKLAFVITTKVADEDAF